MEKSARDVVTCGERVKVDAGEEEQSFVSWSVREAVGQRLAARV